MAVNFVSFSRIKKAVNFVHSSRIKKAVALLLVWILSGNAVLAAAYGSTTVKFGDIDGDGMIEGRIHEDDYELLMQHISGQKVLSAEALISADINADGAADRADLEILRNYQFAVDNPDIADLYEDYFFCTVSFDPAGGLGVSNMPVFYRSEYGGNQVLPAAQREGYLFQGWFTASGAAVTNNTQVELKQDHTLYAKWTPAVYTVAYDANGGSGTPPPQTKYFNQPMTVSGEILWRTGYTFLGWSEDRTASLPAYLPYGAYTDNAGAVLYAVWKQNPSGAAQGIQNPSDGTQSTQDLSGKAEGTQAQIKKTKRIDRAYRKNGKVKIVVNLPGKLRYASSDRRVAAVDKKGIVRIKGCGRAVITVSQIKSGKKEKKPGRKKYGKKVKIPVTITAGAVRGLKTESRSSGTLTMRWNRNTRAKGYELQVSSNRKFVGANVRKGKTYENRTTKSTIGGLVKGRQYYVRIRTYVKDKKRVIYGRWSQPRSARIKGGKKQRELVR